MNAREDGIYWHEVRDGQEVRGGFVPTPVDEILEEAFEKAADEHGLSQWDCPVRPFVDAAMSTLFGRG
jgi:hypothetical protein